MQTSKRYIYIYIAPKSTNESRAQYTPAPTRGHHSVNTGAHVWPWVLMIWRWYFWQCN